MKCIPLSHDVDICVSGDVKLIYKKKTTNDDLENELRRLNAQARAKHLGAGFESHIARTVMEKLSSNE